MMKKTDLKRSCVLVFNKVIIWTYWLFEVSLVDLRLSFLIKDFLIKEGGCRSD